MLSGVGASGPDAHAAHVDAAMRCRTRVRTAARPVVPVDTRQQAQDVFGALYGGFGMGMGDGGRAEYRGLDPAMPRAAPRRACGPSALTPAARCEAYASILGDPTQPRPADPDAALLLDRRTPLPRGACQPAADRSAARVAASAMQQRHESAAPPADAVGGVAPMCLRVRSAGRVRHAPLSDTTALSMTARYSVLQPAAREAAAAGRAPPLSQLAVVPDEALYERRMPVDVRQCRRVELQRRYEEKCKARRDETQALVADMMRAARGH